MFVRFRELYTEEVGGRPLAIANELKSQLDREETGFQVLVMIEDRMVPSLARDMNAGDVYDEVPDNLIVPMSRVPIVTPEYPVPADPNTVSRQEALR